MRQNETWHPPIPKFRPLSPTPVGTLAPCGENGPRTVLEFFANPEDIPALLKDGITTKLPDGSTVKYSVRLTSTPFYENGDVQIQALQQ
jgi:hypothetical protein